MLYDHAVLGETLELCREAAKWFAEEKERLEKQAGKQKSHGQDSPNARKKTSDVFKRKRLEKIRRVSKSGSQRIGEYTKYGVNAIYRR